MPLEYYVIGLVVVLFIWQSYRYRHFQWLWFSVVIWLVFGLFSSYLMPRVLGITHMPNLFIVQFYLFAGSIFFFLNHTHKLPVSQQDKTILTWHSPKSGVWLSTFAVSGLVMHAAFLLLLVLVWLKYPAGQTPMLFAQLFRLYALDPVYWFALQAWLMILMVLHRLILRQHLCMFSFGQIQVMFLLTLVLFFFYVINAYQLVIPLILYFLR